MATIATANITYTLNHARTLGDSRKLNNITLAFGNGTLTYATGGIVLSAASLGCPNIVESMDIVDVGTSGYSFNYNLTTNKLQMFTAASHNHPLWIGSDSGTAGTANQATYATVANGIFSTVGTLSVAGVASGSGTIGGIVTAIPSLMTTELANGSMPLSLSLTVEVMGW